MCASLSVRVGVRCVLCCDPEAMLGKSRRSVCVCVCLCVSQHARAPHLVCVLAYIHSKSRRLNNEIAHTRGLALAETAGKYVIKQELDIIHYHTTVLSDMFSGPGAVAIRGLRALMTLLEW